MYCKRMIFLCGFAIMAVLVGTASAAVEIKVDFGGSGVLDSSWTEWATTSGTKTIDGVDFTLSNSGCENGPKLRSGVGDNLIKDLLSEEDRGTGGWTYTVEITNLPAGEYEITTYFNNANDYDNWGGGTTTMAIEGDGSTSGTVPDRVSTYTEALALTLSFTCSGLSDTTTVNYTGDAQPCICGFELYSTAAAIQFASDASEDFEAETPALIEVKVLNAEASQAYSVDYSIIGGSATAGDDYVADATGTVDFAAGDTSEDIGIDIVADGVDEDDETILLELSNPQGGDAELGFITQHTYTILDPRPRASFEKDGSVVREDAGVALIPVTLSWPATETVEVDYTVSGTATPGDDYNLSAGTLTYDVGDTTETISVGLVDDDIPDTGETVVITLSGFSRGRPGSITEYTLTLLDPTFVDMKVDLAVPDYSTLDPIPATAKSGWTIWSDGSWADLYMHDFKGIRDIGGSGIDLCIDGGCEGRSGLKCYDMCMFLLNGGGAPTGSPVGDPIANTWYTSVDRCDSVGGSEGSSQLGIAGLQPGRYEVKLYHNLWDPSGRSGRICTANGYSGHAIEKVHAWSIADAQAWVDSLPDYKQGPAGDAHRKMKSFLTSDVNNTNGITPIVEPTNVMPSTTTNDGSITTSVVEFETDGSPVIIFCHSGTWQSDQYHGDRAPINAFEITTIPPELPTPCGLYEDGIVDWYDLDVFVENWLIESTSPLNDADFNADGKVNFKDYAILASQWLLSCE